MDTGDFTHAQAAHDSESPAPRLEELSARRGKSLNATVVEILERAVGADERRKTLERYATWTEDDAKELDYGTLVARPIPTNDIWIAATTIQVGAQLLTFDTDFEHVDGLERTVFRAWSSFHEL
jgi:predicted nucleic acid-binding protein